MNRDSGEGGEEEADSGTVGGGDVGEGTVGAQAAAPAVEGGGVPGEDVRGYLCGVCGGVGLQQMVDLLYEVDFVDGAGVQGLLAEGLLDGLDGHFLLWR